MKIVLKSVLVCFTSVLIWFSYKFISFPNTGKIEQKISQSYPPSNTPTKGNYASLVKVDQKEKKVILLGLAQSATMYNRSFPYATHTFNKWETERILHIINDSSSFVWGEIGTPYFDKTIIFYDKNQNEIGYLDFSFDGEIEIFPNLALTKWGLLSDKGFKDLVIAIRAE